MKFCVAIVRLLSVNDVPAMTLSPISYTYRLHFPAIRRIALGSLIQKGRLTRSDLLSFGDYSLDEADLSSCEMEEISESAFESTPSLKYLKLSNNRIRRVDPSAFKPIGRSLQTLDFNNGLRMRNLPCELLFTELRSLLNLNIMSNDIESLSSPDNCFQNLNQLKVLSMDFNSLQTISYVITSCLFLSLMLTGTIFLTRLHPLLTEHHS